MKKFLQPALALAAIAVAISASPAAAATCTDTGFVRDGISMTAAFVNPTNPPAVVDATGCNIGIYYDSGNNTLSNHDIYGANYFGILVNGDTNNVVVHLTNNLVHNIGEVPFNGTQHGVGIYLRAFFTTTITGEVTGNTVFGYQKGGIVANGKGTKLSHLDNNNVFGLGHINFIAQNGIQIGYGAMPYPGQVVGNKVTANSYIGIPGDGSASGGILVVGGPGYGTCPDGNPCPYSSGVLIGISSALNSAPGNLAFNNDVGIYVSNLDADGVSPPPTPTVVFSVGNIVGDDICFNQSYQAGISDQGNTDIIANNYVVQGGGYGPLCGIGIDVTGSTNPIVVGNNVPATSNVSTASVGKAAHAKVQPIKP